jgi:hypothetical protein
MIRLAHKALASVVFGYVFIYSYAASAQTEPEKLSAAIDLTIKAADHLCGSLSQSGSQQSFSLKGDISTQITALLKSLANLGISGVGTYSEETYQGPVRDQLADALKDERRCKENVLSILNEAFIAPHQSSLSDAKLVFTHVEPYKLPFYSTDGKDMSMPSLKMWFKNIGQATAQNEEFVGTMFVKDMKDLLSEKDEDDLFKNLKGLAVTYKKINYIDVQPGGEVYFTSGYGLTDEAWVNYTNTSGQPKFIYVMSILSYQSENLSQNDKIVTETCAIYMNKEGFNSWMSCKSAHNRIYKPK